MPSTTEAVQLDKLVAFRLDTATHQQLVAAAKKRGLSHTIRLVIRRGLSQDQNKGVSTTSDYEWFQSIEKTAS